MVKQLKPGEGSYDQTRKLTLSAEERVAGWEIVTCINCEQGRRRVRAKCELCGSKGLIKVFSGDSFGRSRSGRKKKGEQRLS